MRLTLLLLVLCVGAVGCSPVEQPLPPIVPPEPPTAMDFVENGMFSAVRVWPGRERVLKIGETITILLRVTAKKHLEYVFWREVIGGYAQVQDVNSPSTLEFMVLHIPAGATQEWRYPLTGVSPGESLLEGIIKAVHRHWSEEARIKASVSVR